MKYYVHPMDLPGGIVFTLKASTKTTEMETNNNQLTLTIPVIYDYSLNTDG